MADDSEKKKDLTGIIDLQKLQAEDPSAAAQNEEQDPFAVNELAPIEQIADFESIDQIGMMDHPVEETLPEETPHLENPVEMVFEEAPAATENAPTDFSSDFINPSPPSETFSNDFSFSEPSENPPVSENTTFESPVLSEVKTYSEKTQGRTHLEVKIHYPFHLKIQGTFGPFERDKLLIFITENPIGLSSSDLDLQLQSGRVLLPRISEYAAVKLVQDLRDSGLSFQLHPSDRDADDSASLAPQLSYHYQNTPSPETSLSDVRILSEGNYEEIDQVSMVQFVKTEMIEVENSPVIQEVIEKMTEALKQKARLKGGNALFHLQKEILPLRLPSQYQISLKASVIKL